MITQTFDLDITPGAVPVIVHLKQYQSEGFLVFNLFSRHGTMLVGLITVECVIRGTKKDGNGYSKHGTVMSVEFGGNGCTVGFEIDEQMTAIAGMNPFEIVLTDSDGRTVTATFFLDVQRAALDADTVESESVIRELDEAVEKYIEENPSVVGDVVGEYISEHPELLQDLTIGVEYDDEGNVTLLARNTIPDGDNEEY